MKQKGYVFISYSTKDGLFVEMLTDLLKSCQISYWKAPEMIPAGSNYAREIPQAIQKCEVFLLILSESSQNSIWVEKEVDTAIRYHKRVIPIKIDDNELNEMYYFYLNNVQFVDACVTKEMPWNKVREKLKVVFLEWNQMDKKVEDAKVVLIPDVVIKEESVKKSVTDTRSNALRMNKIPLQCEYCGGRVEQTRMGVYTCLECRQENYDEFRKVRNFLERVGAAPAAVIAKNTGVSLRTIDYFFKNDCVSAVAEEKVHSFTAKGACRLEAWKK